MRDEGFMFWLASMLIALAAMFCSGFLAGFSQVSNTIEKDWQKKMDAGLIRVFDEKSESYIWTKVEAKGKS